MILVHKLNSLILRFKNFITHISFIRIKKEKQIIINGKCMIDKNNNFEEKIRFEDGCFVSNSIIGFGTFLGPNCKVINTRIGRFCSVAEGLKIIAGNHPTQKFVSTHPAFFSITNQLFSYVDKQLFEELTYCDVDRSLFVCIANDVWIGANVTILAGVSIGDGAIIGAGALVTNNLEPYGIYVGVPAKKIGSRFKEEEIKFLLDFKWWNNSELWLKENAYLFDNVQSLINKHTKELKKRNNNV